MSLDKQKFQNNNLHEDKLDILKKHFPDSIITNENENGSKTYEINVDKLSRFFNSGESLLTNTPDKPKDGYELSWVGKKFAYQEAFQSGDKILKTERHISKNFDKTENVVLIGDNLDALKLLRQNYHNSIKCIYIDPPYNTGSDDFIYKDKFSENDEAICELLGYDEAHKDRIKNISSSKAHSAWMSFMLSRLLLAKELLTDDGVIFISIDDNEQANLKIVSDEIFGENMIDMIVWRKSGVGRDGKMKNTTTFRKDHEYILVGFKKELYLNKSYEKPEWENQYPNSDDDPRGAYKSGSISRKEEASNINHKNYYTVTSPSGKSFTRQFEISKKEFCKLDSDSRIYWGKNQDAVPALKVFENEKRTVTTSSAIIEKDDFIHATFINEKEATTTKGSKELDVLFNYDGVGKDMRPKPSYLITKLIQISTNTNDNDIILDFFAGSGTTGDAVMQLNAEDGGNRKFILVQLDEDINSNKKESKPAYEFCKDNNFEPVISSITIGRLNRAGDKIIKDKPELKNKLDIGYRVFSIKDDLEHKLLNTLIPDIKQDDLFSSFENIRKNSELYSRENLLYNAFIYNNIDLSANVSVLKENILYNVDDKFFCFGEITREDILKALENYPNAYFTVFAGGEYVSDSFIHTCKAYLEQISSNITFKVHG